MRLTAAGWKAILRWYEMIFEEFVQRGKVIVGEKDISKAKALVKMSENNMKAAESIELTDAVASPVFSMLYESLREIIEAMCLMEGYKVYSHEAFTSYLEKINEEKIAAAFDRFRKLRNGVNYYGKPVSINVTSETKKEIMHFSKILREKYLKF